MSDTVMCPATRTTCPYAANCHRSAESGRAKTERQPVLLVAPVRIWVNREGRLLVQCPEFDPVHVTPACVTADAPEERT